MPASRKNLVTITSLDSLLGSFLIDVPPDYRFETARIQIYPIAYFLPFLRVPTPLNTASYSYLIVQKSGRGVVAINADVVEIAGSAAAFVNRGSVVSLRSIDPSTSGWMIMYDDASAARALRPAAMEAMTGVRSAIALTNETLEWAEGLCALLERQTAAETTDHQPASEHLFAALVERLLGEHDTPPPRAADRAQSLDVRFRRLVFEHAAEQGSVGFYAERLNVSENYLLRCVTRCSGRSPKDWIIDVRLMLAQKLLRTTDAGVAEIAARAGFDDPSYFARLFRRRFGMSPRAFRTIPRQDSSA
jgi:AraC-like DNA-binding protein